MLGKFRLDIKKKKNSWRSVQALEQALQDSGVVTGEALHNTVINWNFKSSMNE